MKLRDRDGAGVVNVMKMRGKFFTLSSSSSIFFQFCVAPCLRPASCLHFHLSFFERIPLHINTIHPYFILISPYVLLLSTIGSSVSLYVSFSFSTCFPLLQLHSWFFNLPLLIPHHDFLIHYSAPP